VIEAMRAVAPPTVAVADCRSEWLAIEASHRLAAAHQRSIESQTQKFRPLISFFEPYFLSKEAYGVFTANLRKGGYGHGQICQ
jgi:hypothetical protein